MTGIVSAAWMLRMQAMLVDLGLARDSGCKMQQGVGCVRGLSIAFVFRWRISLTPGISLTSPGAVSTAALRECSEHDAQLVCAIKVYLQ